MPGIDVGMNFEKSKKIKIFVSKIMIFEILALPARPGPAWGRHPAGESSALPAFPGPRPRGRPVPPIDGGVEALGTDLQHTF